MGLTRYELVAPLGEQAEYTNDLNEPDDSMPDEKVVGKVKLLNVRAAFPNLIEAEAYQDNAPKYNITLLVPKSDAAQVSAIGQAIKETINEHWPIGGKWTAQNQRPQPEKIAFQDGNKKEWDGYPDNWYIHATANVGYEPKVIDQLKRPITKEGVIYGGCYVNAIIKFWAWENQRGGRGVSASIMAVQFAADGERFGGAGVDVDTEFDTLAVADGFGEEPSGQATGQVGLDPSKPIGENPLPF